MQPNDLYDYEWKRVRYIEGVYKRVLGKELQLPFPIFSTIVDSNFQFPGYNQQTGQRTKYKRAMIWKRISCAQQIAFWLIVRIKSTWRTLQSKMWDLFPPLTFHCLSSSPFPCFAPDPSIPNTHFVLCIQYLYYRFCQVCQLFLPRRQLHWRRPFACCPDLSMTSSGTQHTTKEWKLINHRFGDWSDLKATGVTLASLAADLTWAEPQRSGNGQNDGTARFSQSF